MYGRQVGLLKIESQLASSVVGADLWVRLITAMTASFEIVSASGSDYLYSPAGAILKQNEIQ